MTILTADLLVGKSTLAASEERSIPPLSNSLRLEKPLSFCRELVPLKDSDRENCDHFVDQHSQAADQPEPIYTEVSAIVHFVKLPECP